MTLQDLGFTSPVPLVLFTLVFGFILGWLIMGISPRSKITRLESQAADLNAKLNQANQTITTSQAREKDLQAGLDASNASLAQATGQVEALRAEAAAAHQKEAELRAALAASTAGFDRADAQARLMQDELAERDAEVANLKLQQAALRDTAQQSYGAYNAQVQSLQAELESVCDENKTLKINLEGTSKDLAKARADLETIEQAAANKDIALNEAYVRAVRLERESTDEQSQVLSLQTEVAALKRNVSTLTAANQELNGRVERARGEVASELAALTSTMLRVRDEELAQANATITALQAQMALMAERSVAG